MDSIYSNRSDDSQFSLRSDGIGPSSQRHVHKKQVVKEMQAMEVKDMQPLEPFSYGDLITEIQLMPPPPPLRSYKPDGHGGLPSHKMRHLYDKHSKMVHGADELSAPYDVEILPPPPPGIPPTNPNFLDETQSTCSDAEVPPPPPLQNPPRSSSLRVDANFIDDQLSTSSDAEVPPPPPPENALRALSLSSDSKLLNDEGERSTSSDGEVPPPPRFSPLKKRPVLIQGQSSVSKVVHLLNTVASNVKKIEGTDCVLVYSESKRAFYTCRRGPDGLWSEGHRCHNIRESMRLAKVVLDTE